MKLNRLLLVAITIVGTASVSLTRPGGDRAFGDDPALADQQQQVAERYRRLEELLLRLADVEADENAERAALLRRAAKQSREMFVLDKLSTASQSLRNAQFKNAIDQQSSAKDGLDQLLKLLLSEDRPQRIRDEKERVGKMIKDLKLVERLQRSTRARTENGQEFESLEEEQRRITERAEQVDQALSDEQETDSGESEDAADTPAAESRPGDESTPTDPQAGEQPSGDQPPVDTPADQPSEDTPGDRPPGDEKAGDEKAGDEKSGDQQPGDADDSDAKESGDQQPGDSEKSDSGDPSEPSDGEQSAEQPSEDGAAEAMPSDPGDPGDEPAADQPQMPQTPEQQAQAQLQQAIESMQRAKSELERAEREEAVDQQRKAEADLRAAIDRLEKILRQLREEEMQRELARLESRLRKMAQMQGKVLDDTKLLDAIPAPQRDRQFDVRAGNLAFEEKKIVMEADRALLLLREEGSSVAFPEVVDQIRSDMERVAQRLTASKVDLVTVGIQEDILAALEEMIAALQKAQRDLEKQRQEEQPPQQQPGQPSGEQPLVEQIAELKLIRTMETRIMSTTERYAKVLAEDGDAADVLPLVRDLAERQSNLYRITRDIVQQRNQ